MDTASPSPDASIDRRIMAARHSLTHSEQRLARVVLDAQPTLASFTAAELAGRANVSNATAARFFQHLGYASFNEARRQARDTQPPPPWPPAQTPGPPPPGNSFAHHAAQDRLNLARTADALPEPDLQAATELLARADTIWVAGLGPAAPLAALARARLLPLKPDIRPLHIPSLPEELVWLRPGQAILLIAFQPTPLLTPLLDAARRADTPLILLPGDRLPSREAATVTLPSQRGPLDSDAAIVSLLAHLTHRLAATLGPQATKRLTQITHLREALLGPPTPPRRSPRR